MKWLSAALVLLCLWQWGIIDHQKYQLSQMDNWVKSQWVRESDWWHLHPCE